MLVHRQLRIGAVTVDGLDLNLSRLADGRVNWSLGPEGSGSAPPSPAKTLSGEPAAAAFTSRR